MLINLALKLNKCRKIDCNAGFSINISETKAVVQPPFRNGQTVNTLFCEKILLLLPSSLDDGQGKCKDNEIVIQILQISIENVNHFKRIPQETDKLLEANIIQQMLLMPSTRTTTLRDRNATLSYFRPFRQN